MTHPISWRTSFAVLGSALLLGCAAFDGGPVVHATPNAPAAIGPYAQMVQAGDLYFLSGVIPLTLDGKAVQGRDVEEQTRVVLEYVGATLRSQGLGFRNVVMSNVYLVDLNQFGAFNKVYAEYFPVNPPARASVQVARLPRDVLVEIAVVARR